MMKYIDADKLIAEIERRLNIVEPHKDTFESAAACRQELIWMKDFITSLQQEQPMPDSTQLIEFWHKDKEMLKEKDFRDDAWRLAYNAFMCGFGRGISVKKQEQPEVDLEEEAYMRGFAQGAKEERESLSHTMLTYAADVFGGKMLLEDISYSYRQELADYFRDLAK